MIQNLLHDIIHNALQESVVQLAQSSSEKQKREHQVNNLFLSWPLTIRLPSIGIKKDEQFFLYL